MITEFWCFVVFELGSSVLFDYCVCKWCIDACLCLGLCFGYLLWLSGYCIRVRFVRRACVFLRVACVVCLACARLLLACSRFGVLLIVFG